MTHGSEIIRNMDCGGKTLVPYRLGNGDAFILLDAETGKAARFEDVDFDRPARRAATVMQRMTQKFHGGPA